MKVYLAGPMSGLSYEESKKRFDERAEKLTAMGIEVWNPFDGIEDLAGEAVLKPSGYEGSAADEEIFDRTLNGIEDSNVLWVDFLGAKQVSIGSCFEMGMACAKYKYTVVTMEPDNIHRHAFTLMSADDIYISHEEVYQRLEQIQCRRI